MSYESLKFDSLSSLKSFMLRLEQLKLITLFKTEAGSDSLILTTDEFHRYFATDRAGKLYFSQDKTFLPSFTVGLDFPSYLTKMNPQVYLYHDQFPHFKNCDDVKNFLAKKDCALTNAHINILPNDASFASIASTFKQREVNIDLFEREACSRFNSGYLDILENYIKQKRLVLNHLKRERMRATDANNLDLMSALDAGVIETKKSLEFYKNFLNHHIQWQDRELKELAKVNSTTLPAFVESTKNLHPNYRSKLLKIKVGLLFYFVVNKLSGKCADRISKLQTQKLTIEAAVLDYHRKKEECELNFKNSNNQLKQTVGLFKKIKTIFNNRLSKFNDFEKLHKKDHHFYNKGIFISGIFRGLRPQSTPIAAKSMAVTCKA